MERKKYEIRLFWSDELTEDQIISFINIQGLVFGNKQDYRAKFNKKFIQNPYGASLFILAFDQRKCIGTQVFWRNDINNSKAYQSCDSAILQEYQGQGLFSQMVKMGVEHLKDAVIYGFPNSKSIGAFKKMGWVIDEVKKTRKFWLKDLDAIETIDGLYARWMLDDPSEIVYTVKKGEVLLLRIVKYNICQVVAKIADKDISKDGIRRIRYPIILMHSKDGKYGVGTTLIYTNNKDGYDIPDYKMDVWLYG